MKSLLVYVVLLLSINSSFAVEGFKPDFPPGYLKEYSVIYTDRAVNLMSDYFITAMNDIIDDLCEAYGAKNVALIPGSGTMGMEAAARQFALNKPALVVRNGYFSYRWSAIDELSHITDNLTVMKAEVDANDGYKVSPPKIEDVIAKIHEIKPAAFFIPHVETSVGLVLSDDYIRAIAKAVREVDGIFVLDGIAAGSLWVDMANLGVDVYLTAPQKSWTAPAGLGIVMLGERAVKRLETTTSNSFSLDLKKWVSISDAYKAGGFAYHSTVPSDVMITFRDAIKETKAFGFEKARRVQTEMGNKFRDLLERYGYPSAAADGWRAPTVIVSYAKHNMVPFFKSLGLQVAGKVPFMIDEPTDLMTFRIGLFGLDKLYNPEKHLEEFENALKHIQTKTQDM